MALLSGRQALLILANDAGAAFTPSGLSNASGTGTPRAQGRDMTLRVLVVSARADREALVELLRMRGYEALAGDAHDWRSAAQLVHPDVVLIDAAVPGIEGPHALRTLRSVAPQARLILMTARPNRELSGAGVTCVGKPIDLGMLERAMHVTADRAWCAP